MINHLKVLDCSSGRLNLSSIFSLKNHLFNQIHQVFLLEAVFHTHFLDNKVVPILDLHLILTLLA